MFKAESERERERVSFSHKRHVYVTISEEYPKEEDDGKKMDDGPKNEKFLEGRPKKRANLDVRELLRTLCAHSSYSFEDPTTFKRYETKNNESTFTERRLCVVVRTF